MVAVRVDLTAPQASRYRGRRIRRGRLDVGAEPAQAVDDGRDPV